MELAADLCGDNKVSAVFDHVPRIGGQVRANAVACRPVSNRWFTPIVAQLVLDESVVRELSDQPPQDRSC